MIFNTVCVVGLGYIGLPTAAVFAGRRVNVVGVDVNRKAVETINRGEIHIVEPELDIAVHAAVKEGYLRATTEPEQADAFLIAVPTPFKRQADPDAVPDPDLSYIQAAAESVAPVLKRGDLVILESTSPVGATEQLAEWLAGARPDLSFPQNAGEAADIRVAHCPERVLPGRIMHELIENDRIIGGMTPACARAARDLYQHFVRGECLLTTARTAEMAKLTENAFRDVNIAFANELSIIAERLDINVWELIKLANRHPRVNILQPGPGVGGHCIAVDPWFIVSQTPDQARLIRAARNVNSGKPDWVVEKIKVAVAEALQCRPDARAADLSIAFFGLAFKPDIDDLRESPALDIVEKVACDHPGKVLAVEPNIKALPDTLSGMRAQLVNIEAALADADILVALVAHRSFVAIDRAALEGRTVIDTCGLWSSPSA
ncbi:MAG: UDP-N-acetyl-D-mannosamine dehydrogenase [Alcanivorax sp.]|nr:UDP-N-acetyl-D-mannosamine dehydrogenase [Alcanivorax sp.]